MDTTTLYSHVTYMNVKLMTYVYFRLGFSSIKLLIRFVLSLMINSKSTVECASGRDLVDSFD